MNKIIVNTTLAVTLCISGLFAVETNKKSTTIYTMKGNVEAAYNVMMDKPIKALGYRLPDPRKGVNAVYKKQYGSTTLEVLNFMTIVNDKKMKPLLEIDPRLAGFNPFNLVIYKHKNKDETVISHLTASAMLEMLQITDTTVVNKYTNLMNELDDLVSTTFPKASISHNTYTGEIKDPMMHFQITFDRPEDLDDYIDEIQEKVEDTFTKKGYIMAGFFDYKQGKPDLLPSYDAFWTFSLCHFPYSYAIFDNEGAMPQAAVFAPCTMYMYIKKDSNTLVMGMPRLANWNKLFPMQDKKRLDFLEKLDADIPATFEAIGFKKKL
jgi:uncharacterized protein (DUF302 family)